MITGLRTALLALMLSGTALAQTPAPALPADPATLALMARMKAIPQDRAVESPEAYTPAETVTGRAAPPTPSVTPAQAGISEAALANAQAYADGQNSFALIVARNGKIAWEHYAPGFSAASKYSTASMHKAVVALAFGPAIAAGKIALSDRVDRWLPELAGDPKGASTIEQLLRMTAGLGVPPGGAPYAPGGPSSQLMFATDIRTAAAGFAVVTPPDTEFAYANVSTQLAGLALSAAVGGRYADWLSAKLWAPIGAGDAALWLDRPGGNPHYFCCLQATARDWLRVGELIRNQGRVGRRKVIASDWVKAITAASPLNPNFGMNIWRGSPHVAVRRYGKAQGLTVAAKDAFARDDVVFIDGAGAQRVYVVPSAGLTIVRIGKPALGWDDSALVNMVLAGVK